MEMCDRFLQLSFKWEQAAKRIPESLHPLKSGENHALFGDDVPVFHVSKKQKQHQQANQYSMSSSCYLDGGVFHHDGDESDHDACSNFDGEGVCLV